MTDKQIEELARKIYDEAVTPDVLDCITVEAIEAILKSALQNIEEDEREPPPVLIGKLTVKIGVKNLKGGQIGSDVYETSDRYFIETVDENTGANVRVPFYKETLQAYIQPLPATPTPNNNSI